MKYSQFVQFNFLLESNKISIDEWLKNNIDLNEAEVPSSEEPKENKEASTDSLNTKKGNILTKRGRLRNSLNGHAKKLMEGINKDVADKFLKPIYDLKIEVYKKMAELGKGKQPKEIANALKIDLQNIQKTQAKQLAQIEKYAQTSIDNFTKKINATIEKKGLKDTTKMDLQSYWGLLTTQIMMNLFQKIAAKDDNLIGETIKDPDIIKAAKLIAKTVNKDIGTKSEELKKKAEAKKTEIKASDEKLAAEEKPAEQTEKPVEQKEEKI